MPAEWRIVAAAVVILLAGAACYVLYLKGLLAVNAKKALLFSGSNGGKNLRFTSCEGYVLRIVRFEEDREYTFELTAPLTKGEVSVELLDAGRQEVLRLSGSHDRAGAMLNKGARYYLIYRFKSATGSLALRWE